jgi:hypothetical protein
MPAPNYRRTVGVCGQRLEVSPAAPLTSVAAVRQSSTRRLSVMADQNIKGIHRPDRPPCPPTEDPRLTRRFWRTIGRTRCIGQLFAGNQDVYGVPLAPTASRIVPIASNHYCSSADQSRTNFSKRPNSCPKAFDEKQIDLTECHSFLEPLLSSCLHRHHSSHINNNPTCHLACG